MLYSEMATQKQKLLSLPYSCGNSSHNWKYCGLATNICNLISEPQRRKRPKIIFGMQKPGSLQKIFWTSSCCSNCVGVAVEDIAQKFKLFLNITFEQYQTSFTVKVKVIHSIILANIFIFCKTLCGSRQITTGPCSAIVSSSNSESNYAGPTSRSSECKSNKKGKHNNNIYCSKCEARNLKVSIGNTE